MLASPEFDAFSCDDCEKWQTIPGTAQFYILNPRSRNAARRPRPANTPTPCAKCPKCEGFTEKSSRIGRLVTLSDKNRRTIQVYYEVQATFGRCLSEVAANDAVLVQNMGIIAEAIAEFEREQGNTVGGKLDKALRKLNF
jgi:hypothetical protein